MVRVTLKAELTQNVQDSMASVTKWLDGKFWRKISYLIRLMIIVLMLETEVQYISL